MKKIRDYINRYSITIVLLSLLSIAVCSVSLVNGRWVYASVRMAINKPIPTNNIPTPAVIMAGAWLNDFEKSHPDNECASDLLVQIKYLKGEKLAQRFTFDKHMATTIVTREPVDLNINSNKYARVFRTRIRQELEKEGVNFAGHYSIVSIGLTGWGSNDYIINRKTGKAFVFPYKAYSLGFNKDSNLLIVNPKEDLLESIKDSYSYSENCGDVWNWVDGPKFTDLRPLYFLWQNDELKLLGPENVEPTINRFWEGYF